MSFVDGARHVLRTVGSLRSVKRCRGAARGKWSGAGAACSRSTELPEMRPDRAPAEAVVSRGGRPRRFARRRPSRAQRRLRSSVGRGISPVAVGSRPGSKGDGARLPEDRSPSGREDAHRARRPAGIGVGDEGDERAPPPRRPPPRCRRGGRARKEDAHRACRSLPQKAAKKSSSSAVPRPSASHVAPPASMPAMAFGELGAGGRATAAARGAAQHLRAPARRSARRGSGWCSPRGREDDRRGRLRRPSSTTRSAASTLPAKFSEAAARKSNESVLSDDDDHRTVRPWRPAASGRAAPGWARGEDHEVPRGAGEGG